MLETFSRSRDLPASHDRFPRSPRDRSGRQVCGLARPVVCHHALKDLAGEKAFETADDLPFGPPFSGASFDVVEGWCVELHPHDDGPVERGVGLAMSAAVEAVGVGARMRAGLRASNRRARHLPMRYETGLPSSVIRFRT